MSEKVTTMVLKVDLQCHHCYKKVKKILCQFPPRNEKETEIDVVVNFVNEQEVRDQIYDEKQNLVIIKVVSSCPEKIMQKIRCKGGRAIQSIEIKVPEEPKKPEKEKPEKEKEKEKPEKEKEKEKEKPEKEKEKEKPDKKPDRPQPPPRPEPEPVKPHPIGCVVPVFVYPIGTCCGPCCWGPCFPGPGGPCPRGYGGDYFSEENPSGCTIM